MAEIREHTHPPGSVCPGCLDTATEQVRLWTDRYGLLKDAYDKLGGRLAAAQELLDEWMQTPYFGNYEKWIAWVREFKPRVVRVLHPPEARVSTVGYICHCEKCEARGLHATDECHIEDERIAKASGAPRNFHIHEPCNLSQAYRKKPPAKEEASGAPCQHMDWGYDEGGEAFCHDCQHVIPMSETPHRILGVRAKPPAKEGKA